MRLRIIEPFSLALILWASIHGAYVAKAGAEQIAAHHRKVVAKKKLTPQPPRFGKRARDKFFKEYIYLDGVWVKRPKHIHE